MARLSVLRCTSLVGALGLLTKQHPHLVRLTAIAKSPAVPAVSSSFRCAAVPRRSMGGMSSKGVTYGANGEIERCLFCNICAGQKRQTEIAYEDDRVVVFSPLGRCAAQHWLVVPKQHIQSARSLTKEHLAILTYMKEVGIKTLKQRSPDSDPSTHQYCFHIPPFNSIDHLHLHCQVSDPVESLGTF